MYRTLNRWFLIGTLVTGGLSGCSGDATTGPVAVSWDRDACDRCRMVLSDRVHTAQVRGGPEGGKQRVYLFDDIGCAVIWLDEQAWKDGPGVEIWVTDHRDGHWIDARNAWYVDGNHTPMGYGLGAQDQPADGALRFAAARERIYDVEARYNDHSQHLETVQR